MCFYWSFSRLSLVYTRWDLFYVGLDLAYAGLYIAYTTLEFYLYYPNEIKNTLKLALSIDSLEG